MSERRWTKGPWRWNMDEDGVGTLYGGELEAPKVVADFWRKGLRDVPQDTRFDRDLKAEQTANLNVSSAAPDLFAALERTAQLLHDHFGDQSSEDGWKNEEVRDAWLAARAALSRAEGK